MKKIVTLFLLSAIALLSIQLFQAKSKNSKFTYELRGRYKTSSDKNTYLVIEGNNGGKCGLIYVDKVVWKYNSIQKGKIKAGTHNIECGTLVEISIKEGTTYYFDYWGP